MSPNTLSSEKLAPVCLFAFNRPQHTLSVIEALKASPLAKETEVYVFIDGPRSEDERALVDEVAGLFIDLRGFAEVHLSRREANAGLATSIIEGVSHVVEKHGRVIVLEDDIVTSPAFLSYMNKALQRYENTANVWHISAYCEPYSKADTQHGLSFLRFMSCWGWATWANRWSHFEKNPEELISSFSDEEIFRFNLDGASDFWVQVLDNARGEINTWAIFWYATIFRNGGLCLSPHESYAENIGLDGSGVHCGEDLNRPKRTLNTDGSPHFPDIISEDEKALERLRTYKKPELNKTQKLAREWRRLRGQARRLFGAA